MPQLVTDGFAPGDDELAVSILEKWSGGPIGDKLFNLIAGMMPTTGIVVVILYNLKDPEVVFVPRPSGDPRWQDKLNLPGKMFRNADFKRPDQTPRHGPLERIKKSEIESEFPKEPQFAGVNLNSDARGSWAVLVYSIVLESKEQYHSVGEWVKVSEIETRTDLINTEINHVNIALNKVKCT